MRRVTLLPLFFLFVSSALGTQDPASRNLNAIQRVTSQAAEPPPAVKENPSRAIQLLEEGNQHYEAKHYSEAAAIYRRATEIEPASFSAWFNLGVALVAEEKYEPARAAFHKAQLLRPDAPRVYEYLGMTSEALSENAEAVNAYNSALKLNGKSLIANNNLGHVLLRQGRYVEAEAYLQQALSISPDSKEAVGGLCLTTSFLREHVRSLEACKWATQLNKEPGVFVYLLANAQYNLEQYSNALATYAKARELGVETDLIANGLAYCYLHLHDYQKALELFQQAITADPNLAEAYIGMGTVYFKMRQFKNAVKSFQGAVHADPESSSARYSLAISCLNLRLRNCALQQYNTLKTLDTGASNRLFTQIFRDRVVDARKGNSQ
jgi:tetratricopeptide (TPR) repeat protein